MEIDKKKTAKALAEAHPIECDFCPMTFLCGSEAPQLKDLKCEDFMEILLYQNETENDFKDFIERCKDYIENGED